MTREKILEARHIATCTEYNKSHIERVVGMSLEHKMTRLYHGLDLAFYQPTELVQNPGRTLILSVGQLTERKGFAHLIQACRGLKDRGYDFECHIVGSGPEYEGLSILVNQLVLQDTVRLCGALPHEEVIEKYRKATLFVLPCVMSK